jgi:hypothetical protein
MRKISRMDEDRERIIRTCGCSFFLFLFNITVGSLCFDYCLWTYFGKDIPWYGDVVCGLVTGQFIVPFTIVAFVLQLCGVETPFFTIGHE